MRLRLTKRGIFCAYGGSLNERQLLFKRQVDEGLTKVTTLLADKKYILTLWQDDFDYDGLTNYFAIVAGYYNLPDAQAGLKHECTRLEFKQTVRKTWHSMELPQVGPPSVDINETSRVLARAKFKTGDGSGFNSIYNQVDIVELVGPVSLQMFKAHNFGGTNEVPVEIPIFFHGCATDTGFKV